GGAKMSKSLGNIERVHDLVRQHPPEALRLALLSAHYRQPLDWSDALIEQSVRTLDRLYGTTLTFPFEAEQYARSYADGQAFRLGVEVIELKDCA
ncbi:class I tRNA ligase family protein, partial [Mesorhizobium sp. M4B.F.Ca.ET.215.01.1.1]|uniref:class I tRNA ligase family protein n=1 Tax=Mesorhizobium sp. M4B.F.Ca.ET.215.01.1.1 TaxID=2563956 RepID=UPI001AEE8ED0